MDGSRFRGTVPDNETNAEHLLALKKFGGIFEINYCKAVASFAPLPYSLPQNKYLYLRVERHFFTVKGTIYKNVATVCIFRRLMARSRMFRGKYNSIVNALKVCVYVRFFSLSRDGTCIGIKVWMEARFTFLRVPARKFLYLQRLIFLEVILQKLAGERTAFQIHTSMASCSRSNLAVAFLPMSNIPRAIVPICRIFNRTKLILITRLENRELRMPS